MSLAMAIIPSDRATSDMQRLAAAMDSDLLDDAVGRAIQNEIRNHFFELDAERPNQLSGRRTHWYSEAGQGTSYQAEPGNVKVSIVQEGIRTRILGTEILPGGVIVPIDAKYLTIPANAEAYGKRAGEFENLVMLFGKRDGEVRPVALVQGTAELESIDEAGNVSVSGRKVDKSKSGRQKLGGASVSYGIFFWLVDQVKQDPDPTLIPTQEQMVAAAFTDLDEYFSNFEGGIKSV